MGIGKSSVCGRQQEQSSRTVCCRLDVGVNVLSVFLQCLALAWPQSSRHFTQSSPYSYATFIYTPLSYVFLGCTLKQKKRKMIDIKYLIFFNYFFERCSYNIKSFENISYSWLSFVSLSPRPDNNSNVIINYVPEDMPLLFNNWWNIKSNWIFCAVKNCYLQATKII